MSDAERASNTGISRRTVAKAMAWSAPVIAVAATVPAVAASLRKDPGINGWVLNSSQYLGNCRWELTVDSDPSNGGQTPDGAPFGLYVYDTEDPNVISDAKLTYWIIGNHAASGSSAVSWQSQGGHSSCWSGPTHIGTATKPDGLTYTGYQWTYSCTIDPTTRVMDPDGVERLYLGNFHVQARFNQSGSLCNNVTYWTQRHITIDPDGQGPLPSEVHTFQRRNGTLGPMSGGSGARMAPQARSAGPEIQNALS